MSTGISARHGGHHVAQKFMNTTLPFHAALETGLPSRSFTKNAGIGCGWAAKRTTCASSPRSAVFASLAANNADDAPGEADADDAECAAGLSTFIARGDSERLAANPIARPASPSTIASTRIKDLFIRRPAPITIMSQTHSVSNTRSARDCVKTRRQTKKGCGFNPGREFPNRCGSPVLVSLAPHFRKLSA